MPVQERTDRSQLRMLRPAHPDLIAAFTPAGPLGPLAGYIARLRYPADLHLWSDAAANLHRARVYCGLGRILDLHFDRRRWRLGAADLGERDGFDPGWAAWMSGGELAQRLPALLRYLDAVIPLASSGRGAVGAAAFAVPGRAVVSQEVGPTFAAGERRGVMHELTVDIRAALSPNPVSGPLAAFKSVSDALFLDARGTLLVSEIEGRRAPEVRFAVAQSIVYLRLLRRWLDSDDSALAAVSELIAGRRSLGLGSPLLDRVAPTGEATALVSIQAGSSPRLLAQFEAVRSRLIGAGVPEAQAVRAELVWLDGTVQPI